MNAQHTQLASGKWDQLPFIEQMANIGSEVIRASNWKKKGNENYAILAFNRALELMSLSMGDKKNTTKLKEIARTYEVLVDYFAGDNVYKSKDAQLEKYFLDFNRAAGIRRTFL